MQTIEIDGKQYKLTVIEKGNGKMIGKISCDYCVFYKEPNNCGDPITRDCMTDMYSYWEEVGDKNGV